MWNQHKSFLTITYSWTKMVCIEDYNLYRHSYWTFFLGFLQSSSQTSKSNQGQNFPCHVDSQLKGHRWLGSGSHWITRRCYSSPRRIHGWYIPDHHSQREGTCTWGRHPSTTREWTWGKVGTLIPVNRGPKLKSSWITDGYVKQIHIWTWQGFVRHLQYIVFCAFPPLWTIVAK